MITRTSDPDIDARARALVDALTLDEKIQLVTGFAGIPASGLRFDDDPTGQEARTTGFEAGVPGAFGTCGFVPGIPRLGIPALHLEGAGVGVANVFGRQHAEAVVFPSALAQTATWNPSLKRAFGQRLAAEARDQGINVLLGGACNLGIEPRSGRNFEYHGEDPLLAGYMVAEEIIGTQEAGVMATIKHFAGNFQETGRFTVNTVVDERSLREGELLVFELAIQKSDVAAVMASYNLLNGHYACESAYLLDEVLKGEWHFGGWVMSDWGATHSTIESAMAGLDQEFPDSRWFGSALRAAVDEGVVPVERLDDMNHRILRQMLRFGMVGQAEPTAPDFDLAQSYDVAQAIAEESVVLLTNDGLLPLGAPQRLLVVGSHADVGVPAGGGSAGVDPRGGSPLPARRTGLVKEVWVPSSPLAAIRAEFAATEVSYDDGTSIDAAVRAAKDADVVVVFAHQWTTEGTDLPDLRLPLGQDALIEAIAAAHPRVVVVLETGGVVLTPWHGCVSAVLEAWYPGHRGAEAIAGILSGRVNPSGKLPVTIPMSEADLPYPVFHDPHHDGTGASTDLVNVTAGSERQFDAVYAQGLDLGYKWFATRTKPAFAFGHGLSYTTFDIDQLKIDMGEDVVATARLRNTGSSRGAEVVQLYAILPDSAHNAPRRLVGWTKVLLEPGAETEVTITVEPRTLAMWDVEERSWRRPPAEFRFEVGHASDHVADVATVRDR